MLQFKRTNQEAVLGTRYERQPIRCRWRASTGRSVSLADDIPEQTRTARTDVLTKEKATSSSPPTVAMQQDRCQSESFLYHGGTVEEENVRLESFCEEDSDSGSWWSYPSECGSVIDVYRSITSRDDYESFRSCLASMEDDSTQQVPPVKIPEAHYKQSPAIALSPERPTSRCVRAYDVDCKSDHGYTGSTQFVTSEPNGLNKCGIFGKEVRYFAESGNETGGALRRRADDDRTVAPSSARHVTFKDLSASSGSEEEDYDVQSRNRNRNGCQGNAKHRFPAGAREADLDDSGYLDGESTSSSSDVSPPGSLAWEAAIDRSGFGECCLGEPLCMHHGAARGESNCNGVKEGQRTEMNGSYPSTSYVHTEVIISECLRREDSYEYVRNDVRVAKLNNVNQTSWTKSSYSDSSQITPPVNETSSACRQQAAAQQPHSKQNNAILKAEASSHVSPSVNGVSKHKPEMPALKRQSEKRESGRKPHCKSDAREVAKREKVEDVRPRRRFTESFDITDEGTSCDIEEDQGAVSYRAHAQRNGKRDVDAAGGTLSGARVSATATARAVARNRARNSDEPRAVSALASARADAEDPYLALAAATAKAATTASVEASNEIYSKRKAFCAPPDLDVIIQTACSVAGEEYFPDRARDLRFQAGPGVVVVPAPPPRHCSPRRDVRPSLPTPVRYNEFSALNLKSPNDMNGDTVFAKEPVPPDGHASHVHTVWTSSDEAPSPATSARSTPTRSLALREDRVRVVRTPMKSNAVIIQDISDSDDHSDRRPVTSTPKQRQPRSACSVQNGYTNKPSVNGRPATAPSRPVTLPVNGAVVKKPPVPNGRPPFRAKPSQPYMSLPPRPKFLDTPVTSEEHVERITGYQTAKRIAEVLPKPQVALPDAAPSPGGRLVSSRRRFFESLQRQARSAERTNDPAERLEHFKASAQEARESLAKSSPDIAALEADVRSRRETDRCRSSSAAPAECPAAAAHCPKRAPANEDRFASTVEQVRKRYPRYCGHDEVAPDLRRRSKSLGYLETDVDTLECRQVNDFAVEERVDGGDDGASSPFGRTRSMDFLMQEENRTAVSPPENALATRAKSEHELRVEKSLQNLQLPEWYTKYCKREGTPRLVLRSSREDSPRCSWKGLGSRTPSSTSLSISSGRNLVIPKRVTPDWRAMGVHNTSRESLTSSPGWASPHDGSLSRWGSVSSAPGSAWSYRSFRQPYLGWRAAAAATPSTGTATPLSSSRPVSPGGPLLGTGESNRATPSIPRDRYSYIQGIYAGGNWNVNVDPSKDPRSSSCGSDAVTGEVVSVSQGSANVKPTVWMESSFVGAKPEGSAASASCTVGEYACSSVGITL